MRRCAGFLALLFLLGCTPKGGEDTTPGTSKNSPAAQLVYEYLKENSNHYPSGNRSSDLQILTEEKDHLGFSHLKFQQIFHSIPVWQKELFAHINKEGSVYRVDANLVAIEDTFSIQPLLSDVDISKLYFQMYDEAENWQIVQKSLVIYSAKNVLPKLAYQLELEKGLLGKIVILDANNATMLNEISTVY